MWHKKCSLKYGVDEMKTDTKSMITGFTLVEVVVALALLVLALTASLLSFVQARRSAMIANNRMTAIHNARQVMETLLSDTYPSASLSNGYHPTNTCRLTNVRYTVVTVTQTPSIIVKNVYLTNYWTNAASRAISTVSLAGSIGEEMHQ